MKGQEASFRGMAAEEDHRKPAGERQCSWTLDPKKKHKKENNWEFDNLRKKPACSKLCDELIIFKKKNTQMNGM